MSISFKDIVKSLLETMDQNRALNAMDPETEAMLERALDKVVSGTDSKITLIPGYRRKLYNSIIKALQFADNLIDQIPEPIDLSSDQFIANPYIRAFFPTLTGLKEVCGQSSELKDYFQEPEHRRTTEICALLCMRRSERSILGMQLDGERVVRDVKQTRVSFENHRIQSPAEDERTARRELKCCIFEGLVNNALANISSLRSRRQQLEARRKTLSSRLRSSRGVSINPIDQADAVTRGDAGRKDVADLKQVEQELGRMGYVTPAVSLDQVNTVLGHPEEFVSLKNISMTLDREGILRSEGENSHSVNRLRLSEVSIMGQPPRVITLARLKRSELVFPELRLPQAL